MSDEIEENIDFNYPPPVDKLLRLGEPNRTGVSDWINYTELGITPENVVELIRMATNKELNESLSDSPVIWAPLHAWRALGQLKAEASIEPFLAFFDDWEGDDWAMEELPEVFGMIGPTAIPALAAFIGDTSHKHYARLAAANGLEEIAKAHPEARTESVTALTRQLEKSVENKEEPDFVAFIMTNLIQLKAVESASVIEQAFAAGAVDENIVGDLEDVQVDLGLKAQRETLRPRYNSLPGISARPAARSESISGFSSTKSRSERKAAKSKRKMAKESRKKNRKR